MEYRKNSINTIRFLAAFQVMYWHAVHHFELQMPLALNDVVNFFMGVPLFFMISGFLIWFSIGRSQNYFLYLKKRFWRIYPELWGGVLLSIITIFVLYDGWNVRDLGLFAITQGTFFQFWTPDSLRGFGCGVPNGALWTIGVIIQYYLIAWFLFKWLRNKSLFYWLVSSVFLSSIFVFLSYYLGHKPENITAKLYGVTVLPYMWMFLLGAFISQFWNKIGAFIIRYWYVFIVLSIVVVFFNIDLCPPIGQYGILNYGLRFVGLLGFAYRCPDLCIKTDISYAMYIYHMIIINVLLQIGYAFEQPYWSLIIVLLLTSAIAYFSTVTIGRWSAKRKTNLVQK